MGIFIEQGTKMKFDLKIGAVTSPNELQLVFREDFMKRILGVNYDAFGDCIVRTQGGESFEVSGYEKNSVFGVWTMEETKKLIPLMDKDELLEFVKDELNEAGITDTADIQREMETGVFGRNFSERGLQAYIRLLKIELAEATSERPRFMDSSMFGEYFAGKYAQLEFEELHLISLNGQLEITSDDLIASGTIDRATFSMNKLFRIMCLNSQPSFMLVHNHPSGSLRPSTQDITTAQNLKSWLR